MFDMRDQGESYFHIRDRQHFVLMNVHGYTCGYPVMKEIQ